MKNSNRKFIINIDFLSCLFVVFFFGFFFVSASNIWKKKSKDAITHAWMRNTHSYATRIHSDLRFFCFFFFVGVVFVLFFFFFSSKISSELDSGNYRYWYFWEDFQNFSIYVLLLAATLPLHISVLMLWTIKIFYNICKYIYHIIWRKCLGLHSLDFSLTFFT